ncbi:hypothetical protein EVJ58_g5028 [Rhodofomes roseus]|uniref:G domain-containing protein n=1 Tax=Rhodofomes roseus TaxID=34475 RepID=A0A4Y9YG20_9APHY|nr:hypothetical protein EVJ58_g5028 [Rhodofomes roseus]
MVDTPGFDDTVKSDADVLTTIATYLERLYRKGIRIRGIIYLHRITDNRMGGTALRNVRMFEAICGEPAMASTAVVLNMWDQVQPGVAQARETELRESDIFFKPAVNAGAQMKPHWGNQDSAAAILDYLVARRPVVLKIQHEMADEHKAIHTTSAGLVLLGDLAAKELKHAEELRRIREERAEARSRKDADEGGLEDSEKSVEALRRKLAEEQQRLLEATNQASDNHGGFHRKLIMFLRRRLQLGH